MRYLCKDALLDMLDFIKQQGEFVSKSTAHITDVEQLLRTMGGMVLYNSSCMCIQTIGETIRQIDDFTDKGFLKVYYPQIAWHKIIGMRNIISHEYSATDPDRVYYIIKESIPELLPVIDEIISDVKAGKYDLLGIFNKGN